MSDGRAWAAEQEERETTMKKLGLCIRCAKRSCDCELLIQIDETKVRIGALEENIAQDKERIKYYKRELKFLLGSLKRKPKYLKRKRK